MDKKENESVEPSSVPKKKKPELIAGVKLTRVGPGTGVSTPAALYDGKAPKVGQRLHFKLANGVTYTGIVADATEADGNVLVEFKDGIKPVLTK